MRSPMRRVLAILAIALVASVGAGADGTTHGPVALYQPPLEPPKGATASDQRLVRAKLFIDAAGKVSKVEINAIEPPSTSDGAFREAAVAGFSAWRFAPAEKDGRAVSSESLVAIPFQQISQGVRMTPASVDWSPTTGSGYELARYDERIRILGLSPAERRKLADATAAKAEGLLKKSTRVTASNTGFEVVTDFGGQKQADGLLHNVTATYAALLNMLGTSVPPFPIEERIRIYVFETDAQYQQLCAVSMPFEGSLGFYSAEGVLAFHTEHPTIDQFTATLLHETTHAFMDRHLVRPGVDLPRWLGEGFAEYIGNSDIKGGKILPGSHKRKQVIGAAPGALAYWQTMSRARTSVAKTAQRQRRSLTLEQIIAGGPEVFYGKDVDLYYAQGWLAVHFLRHGKPAWADDAFPKFLLYTGEGYSARDALRAAYGVDPAGLEAAYQAYVKSF
jgi:hypothetical protein